MNTFAQRVTGLMRGQLNISWPGLCPRIFIVHHVRGGQMTMIRPCVLARHGQFPTWRTHWEEHPPLSGNVKRGLVLCGPEKDDGRMTMTNISGITPRYPLRRPPHVSGDRISASLPGDLRLASQTQRETKNHDHTCRHHPPRARQCRRSYCQLVARPPAIIARPADEADPRRLPAGADGGAIGIADHRPGSDRARNQPAIRAPAGAGQRHRLAYRTGLFIPPGRCPDAAQSPGSATTQLALLAEDSTFRGCLALTMISPPALTPQVVRIGVQQPRRQSHPQPPRQPPEATMQGPLVCDARFDLADGPERVLILDGRHVTAKRQHDFGGPPRKLQYRFASHGIRIARDADAAHAHTTGGLRWPLPCTAAGETRAGCASSSPAR